MRMRRSSPPAAKVRSSNQQSALTERRWARLPVLLNLASSDMSYEFQTATLRSREQEATR